MGLSMPAPTDDKLIKYRVKASGVHGLVVGPGAKPTLFLRNQLRDVNTGKLRWRLSSPDFGLLAEDAIRADNLCVPTITPDGKWVAYWADFRPDHSEDQQRVRIAGVEVASGETGKVANLFPVPPQTQTEFDERNHVPSGREVSLIGLPNDRLLVACTESFRQSARLLVLSLPDGKLVREIQLKELDHKKIAVHATGKYVALLDKSSVLVIELETGKVVVKTPAPYAIRDGGWATSANWSCGGLAFSGDGKRLAGVFLRPQGPSVLATLDIVVWNEKGEIIKTCSFGETHQFAFIHGNKGIQWTPDDGAWLIDHRFLIDSETDRLVWVVQSAKFSSFGDARFADANNVVVKGLVDFAVLRPPLPEIRQALTAIKDNRPARLRPGGSVSLIVEIGDLLEGSKDATQLAFAEAIKRHYQKYEITVAEGQDLVVRVNYTEKKEDHINTITQTRVRVVPAGQDRPIWQRSLDIPYSNSRPTPGGKVSDLISFVLDGTIVPYFIPSDDSLRALPIVTEY